MGKGPIKSLLRGREVLTTNEVGQRGCINQSKRSAEQANLQTAQLELSRETDSLHPSFSRKPTELNE